MTGRKRTSGQRLRRTQYAVRIVLLTAVAVLLIKCGFGVTGLDGLPFLSLSSMVLLAAFSMGATALAAWWTQRRLHDFEEPGWKWLILLVPLVNIFWFIIIVVTDGTVGDNRYGADPRCRLPFYVETSH